MSLSSETDSALDFAARAREFQLDGFTVLRRFFSQEQTAEMRCRVENLIESRLAALPDADVIRSVAGSREIVIVSELDRHDDYFRKLATREELTGVARRLLGADVTPSHVNFINKHHGAPVTQPHQDAYIFTRLPSQSLTCWIALDHIDKENGCLCYVRGSHWGGYRSHDLRPGPNKLVHFSEEDQDHEVAVAAAPGDLLVHHSFTIHRSSDNKTSRPRWALAIPYVRSESEVISKHTWVAMHESGNMIT